MNPAADTLRALVARLEEMAKPQPIDELARLLQLAEDMAMARQLANYGVKL